ncbi:dihydroneopterin aldolase [Alicyclobacillus shizuokensis]|uniref:dihydroneopterin aldolase n=1 Tax=Alicyclobacillus shizuokensis TaxID=392014 RepID=UPI00083531AD|nr:dihydroneopterin aldolase [Alicyclobacillus shizuokensis]MCL6627927.1 dihydroneopterin aldolase [Alicyclobacillus shizuokensis]
MDEIRLTGMHFYGYHGALAEERKLGQRFTVNLVLSLDLKAAGRSDMIAETVDYAAVYGDVKQVVEGPPARLIESVAERIAQRILERYRRVCKVRVEVEKPGAPIPGVFDSVTVCIVRTRAQS